MLNSRFLAFSFIFLLLGQAKSVLSMAMENTQNQATVVYQKEQTGVIRTPQPFLQELPQPERKRPEEASTDPFAAVLAYGWQEYGLKNYRQSKMLFLQAVASKNVVTRRNAQLGLMYSYLKLNDTIEALPLLQDFVAQGEQLESTAPALAGILFKRGDIDALQLLLPKLSPTLQKKWQEQIVFTQFQQQIATINEKSKVTIQRKKAEQINIFFLTGF